MRAGYNNGQFNYWHNTHDSIFGGLLCGFGMGAIGIRKPFMWSLHIMLLLGLLGAITFSSGPMLYLSVGLVGFVAAGCSPAPLTMLMELESMTPAMVGAVFALIFSIGYVAAFFSPIVGG